ncbi:hypothetical protein J7K06_02455 [Candidatus Bathyarchaeota archaeon]|nr:hypothetical protein [Candidatus Bathyarchaeota archaeon]
MGEKTEIRRQRTKRRKEIKNILNSLPSKSRIKEIHEHYDLSRQQLYAAAVHYIDGRFDDSVLHSSLSVEIALLFRLDEKMDKKERLEIQEKGRGLHFGEMIDLGEKKKILSKELAKKCRELNQLRHMYAHPANIVAFVKDYYRKMYSLGENLLPRKMVEEFAQKMPKELIEKLTSEHFKGVLNEMVNRIKVLDKIPDVDWAARQSTLAFHRKRLSNFSREMTGKFLTSSFFKKLIDRRLSLEKLIHHIQSSFPYGKNDALDALNNAYDVLKGLEIIG